MSARIITAKGYKADGDNMELKDIVIKYISSAMGNSLSLECDGIMLSVSYDLVKRVTMAKGE